MRTFRCLECKHEFQEADQKPQALKCPKCLSRFVQLVEGTPLKVKQWGSKSYSVR